MAGDCDASVVDCGVDGMTHEPERGVSDNFGVVAVLVVWKRDCSTVFKSNTHTITTKATTTMTPLKSIVVN